MPNILEDDTTVDERYSVTVPTTVREAATIEAGDALRWRVDESGTFEVELIKRRPGAFTDLDPIELEDETDAADDHDAI